MQFKGTADWNVMPQAMQWNAPSVKAKLPTCTPQVMWQTSPLDQSRRDQQKTTEICLGQTNLLLMSLNVSMNASACCHPFSFPQAKIEYCRHINL
jgi:hypothetical protein